MRSQGESGGWLPGDVSSLISVLEQISRSRQAMLSVDGVTVFGMSSVSSALTAVAELMALRLELDLAADHWPPDSDIRARYEEEVREIRGGLAPMS